jgi:hypothetical protein
MPRNCTPKDPVHNSSYLGKGFSVVIGNEGSSRLLLGEPKGSRIR